ncbi:sugar nucleotide-binding protein [Stieleria sp. TO1_6]|uniref:sugar nucleotide-binding protein n=1 Tax=Stieleria tagensis TaxID=2956795 RepID=UPI00209BA68A|nr:sugar nucleotide-binding protein [Stieleria tagensis]MCO8121621.1 sugar nucleotide-binding protein [Stieleria tagensis]
MLLLLGGNGYVGQAFARHLESIDAPHRIISRSADGDYADAKVLGDLIKMHQATFLVNASGYTGKPNVDACEIHREECLFGNSILPARIRSVCETAGIPWGHVSSGCIYTGMAPGNRPFTEQDPPNFSFRQDNCSFYSGTKALGEELLTGGKNNYVWRLRIPFNHVDSPRNYLSKLMRYEQLLEAENSITHLDEFAEACISMWQQNVPFGTYNVTNPGAITTRRVTELLSQSGICTKDFRFFPSESEFLRVAKAPRSNCVLSSSKLSTYGIQLRDVETAIKDSLDRWISTNSGIEK